MPLNPTIEEQHQALARRAEVNRLVRQAFWLGAGLGFLPSIALLVALAVTR